MTDDPYRVVDIKTGEPVGSTDDPEAMFVDVCRAALLREDGVAYAVVGIGPAGFPDRLREEARIHVIEDPRLGAGALALAGDPDEWPALAAEWFAEPS